MKRVALAAAFVILLVGGLAACGSSKAATPATNPSTSGQTTVQASDALQFSPGTVTISAGQTVRWKNVGSIGHTVTFDNGPSFSQPLHAGRTVTRTFSTAGTFRYHCSIHGKDMHGTIVVK